MQSDEDRGLGGLDAQLACTERESKEFLAAKVHQLESLLKRAQEECSTLRECYQQLREDFQFNLAILDERDRELERYDVLSARALTEKRNRIEELKQLQMQVVKMEEQRARVAEERHDATQQLDTFKCSMAGQIQRQTEEYERMKWDLQCRIRELERELILQKQEITAALTSKLRQQEHEFNLKMDEMRAVMLSQDVKVKPLSKETEVQCQAQLQEVCQQIQNLLQCKEQELKDLTVVKEYRIKELEDKLKWMETKWKKEEENYIKKYRDVIWALKECDVQLEAQCRAFKDQLQTAERQIYRLHQNMEILAAQVQCIQKDQQKAIEQRDCSIQRLCTEVEATRTGWDNYISQVSSEMVVKDIEIIMLQEKETKFRIERERSREEMERYKQQLSAGLKKEKALEQMRVQVELEWQRRCEDMKAELYLFNEQLIQDLTQARDQAQAELKKKEQELQDMVVLLRSGDTERDQAIQGLTLKVHSMASEDIGCLQEQNNILRAVVNQMRKDMEGLSYLLPNSQAQPQAYSPQPAHPEATGPPAQSADMSSSFSPADGLDLEKHVNTSALTKQEVRGHIMGQRPCLQQQQTSSLKMSDGLYEDVQGAKSNRGLHSRLKQAAFCIARLSRDKQQLIEMANHLRGQIITAGLKGCFPQRDLSTDGLGHQCDRLSALEQLQYQLTTQELLYSLRQRTSTSAEQLLPGTNNQGPATKRAANPGSQETDRPESSKKNKENTPQLSLSQSCLDERPHPHSGLSKSPLPSEESLRSLDELWEIIDYGLSPSTFSEGELSRRDAAESGGAGDRIMVNGIDAPTHRQPPAVVQQRRNPSTTPSSTTKTSRPGPPGRISKIRNYNVKD